MGFAVAERLVTDGWSVAIFDVSEETGTQAISALGEGASFHQVDVKDYNAQQRAFEEVFGSHGQIDFVYGNAGIAGRADFYDKPAKWPPSAPSMIVEDINFKGAAYTSHLAMQYMRHNERPGGLIVMTASGR